LVVPAENDCALKELVSLFDVGDLVPSEVKYFKVHDLPPQLKLACGLEVIEGKHELVKLVLAQDENLEPP
jgi:hypothetical protein